MVLEKSTLQLYYSANQLIKKLFKTFILTFNDSQSYGFYDDGEMLPKNKRIFLGSYFTGTINYPFGEIFNNTCIDTEIFNNALKDKCLRLDRTNKGLIMSDGDSGEKYTIASLVDPEDVTKQMDYVMSKTILTPNKEYPTYQLTDLQIAQLIGYQDVTIKLGELRLIATVKLIPTLSKLKNVRIAVLSEPDDDNIYAISIVSSNSNNTFSFVSYHKVINF